MPGTGDIGGSSQLFIKYDATGHGAGAAHSNYTDNDVDSNGGEIRVEFPQGATFDSNTGEFVVAVQHGTCVHISWKQSRRKAARRRR